MSADNYYIIRNHPGGVGFAAVMGFASDDETPEARPEHPPFPTVEAALRWASEEYSEYGVSVHPETERQPAGLVTLPRARVEALCRMLVDSGDMTPMAVRQFDLAMDDAEHPKSVSSNP